VLTAKGSAQVPRSTAATRRTSVATRNCTGWRLIGVLLISAAAMDLARCSLVLLTLRHLAPGLGLAVAGIGAAVLSLTAARGYRAGRPWAGLAALLIGVASAPLASASGFRSPFTIPDLATAVVGIVLAVAVVATAGRGTPVQAAAVPGQNRRASRDTAATKVFDDGNAEAFDT
jgi:hypothetical protein